MPNTELFKKIDRQISAHPETHDQLEWEGWDTATCRTVRCALGWGIVLGTEYDSYWDWRNQPNLVGEFNEANFGAGLFGISYEDAYWLIFVASNPAAAEFVRLMAMGWCEEAYAMVS